MSNTIKKERSTDYDIKKEDIELLFFSACTGRENNDIYNDKREYILTHILTDKFKDYFDDPKWRLIKNGWSECLDTLFKQRSNKTYNKIKVYK